VIIAFGALDMLKGPFTKRMRRQVPHPLDIRLERRLSRVSAGMTVVLGVLILGTIPALHLSLPAWQALAVPPFTLGVGVLSVWNVVVRSTRGETIRRLGSFSFESPPSFDVASSGPQPTEIRNEIDIYERVRGETPISAKVRDYVEKGDPAIALWGGWRKLFQRFAGFLGVSVESVTLHGNTTAAIRRAAEIAVRDGDHVLMSDLEYGSISDLVKGIVSADRLQLVEARGSIVEGRTPVSGILDEIVARAETWFAEHDASHRLVIVLSHVTFEFGAVVDVPELRNRLRDHEGRFVMIVDGAQAVGNVRVDDRTLDAADFYATSGHKWLLGKPTLGFLVSNAQKLRKLGLDESRAIDQKIPFAHYSVKTDYTQETVNLEPHVSVNAALHELSSVGARQIADHNKRLAGMFSRWAGELHGVTVINRSSPSGIVGLRVSGAVDIKRRLEKRQQIVCGAFADDILRCCFHYFMDDDDAYLLFESLNRVINDA